MKARTMAAVLMAGVLAGCAHGSGGGGGGGSSANNQFEANPLFCLFLPFVCIVALFDDSVAGAGSTTGLQPSASFTTWSELQRGTPTQASGLSSSVVFQYDANGRLVSFSDGAVSFGASGSGDLAALGQPGIDRLHSADGSTALVANPYAAGWNYQSFGAWNQQGNGKGAITVSTFGQATPASAVPTSGQATFTGKSAGFYVSPTGQGSIVASDLTVNANFGARSLAFSTSGTTIARDLAAPVAAPHLNLNGSFAYSAGTNAFAGNVSNAGGTMQGTSKGQFYGPAAQELGGTFNLKSATTAETLAGAYGAKR